MRRMKTEVAMEQTARRRVIEDESEIAELISVLMFRRGAVEQWEDGPRRDVALAAIDALISDLEAGRVPGRLS